MDGSAYNGNGAEYPRTDAFQSKRTDLLGAGGEHDIYADLYENIVASAPTAPPSSEVATKPSELISSLVQLAQKAQLLEKERDQLRAKVSQLEKKVRMPSVRDGSGHRLIELQNELLSKQNEVLKRNISCIFKTAQTEIQRKDERIAELQRM